MNRLKQRPTSSAKRLKDMTATDSLARVRLSIGQQKGISAGHSGSLSALRVNGGRNAATILSFR